MNAKTQTAMQPESTRVRDLVRLLDQMRLLYEQMFTAIDLRLAAMRRADVAAMAALAANEGILAERLKEREGLRKQLMDAIGTELGLSGGAGRRLCVSQLANRLGEKDRTSLLSATDRLRKQVANVSQASRIAGAVAKEVVNHVRWVFDAIRPGEEQPTGYSKAGRVVLQVSGPLFETVG